MAKDAEVVTFSRFRADLNRGLARHAKRILESEDIAKEVAALSPLEAYFIVKEIGVGDALELLKHSSPDQLQTFIDLDCWDNGRPEMVELDTWLGAFAAHSPNALLQAFLRLEEEIQVLFLASLIESFDLRNEEPTTLDLDKHANTTTPDGYFLVVSKALQEAEVDPLRLIDLLYRHDVNEAFRLITAAKWESPPILEEQAFQFRQSRVEELGFPDTARAMRIFATPSRQKLQNVVRQPARFPVVTTIPAIYAGSLNEDTLLNHGLSQINDADRLQTIEEQLIFLMNCAAVAFGQTYRNPAKLQQSAKRVGDTLSLGIEQLLSPDHPLPQNSESAHAQDAGQILQDYALETIFQIGHHELLAIKREATSIANDAVVKQWLEIYDDDDDTSASKADRAFLRGLLAISPYYAGYDLDRPRAMRGFHSKRLLEQAEERLAQLRQRYAE